MNSIIYKLVIPVLLFCCLNTAGNSLWKYQFTKTPVTLSNLNENIHLLWSPYILLGIFSYVSSMIIFFFLLSNFKMSYIVPVTALTYIFNILVAVLFFGERISISYLAGIVLILAGIYFISRDSIS